MRELILTGVLAACGPQPWPPASDVLPDARPAGVVTADTYFILSNPNCDAPEPADCVMELGFCTDGSYQHEIGDAIAIGTYEDVYPDILLDTTAPLQFDLEGYFSIDGAGNQLGPWHPATAATDADVRCAR